MKPLQKGEIKKIVEQHIDANILEIQFLDEGNLNYVHLIKTDAEDYYFKQALQEFRKPTESILQLPLGFDRLDKEIQTISLLKTIIKDERFHLPSLVYFDRSNNYAIFGDIAQGMQTIKQKFEQGVINPLDAELAGIFLGIQHNKTADNNSYLRPDKENLQFYNKIINFRTILSAKGPSLKKFIEKKLSTLDKTPPVLITGDFSPKHIYSNGNNLGICDFEFACKGDSNYDLGFFIAHYELMMLMNPGLKQNAKESIDYFLRGYILKNNIDLKQNTLDFYIGTGMLNRINAVPKEKYIDKEKLEEIETRAKELLI